MAIGEIIGKVIGGIAGGGKGGGKGDEGGGAMEMVQKLVSAITGQGN